MVSEGRSGGGAGGREGGGWWFAAFQASEERERALSMKVKNPEISVGTKMDFRIPIGKKLFHFRNGAEPVTRWDTKMAAELVTIETGIKY